MKHFINISTCLDFRYKTTTIFFMKYKRDWDLPFQQGQGDVEIQVLIQTYKCDEQQSVSVKNVISLIF